MFYTRTHDYAFPFFLLVEGYIHHSPKQPSMNWTQARLMAWAIGQMLFMYITGAHPAEPYGSTLALVPVQCILCTEAWVLSKMIARIRGDLSTSQTLRLHFRMIKGVFLSMTAFHVYKSCKWGSVWAGPDRGAHRLWLLATVAFELFCFGIGHAG
jgi:hypothetical protein